MPYTETCLRCQHEFDEPLWTVPIYLPALEPDWQSLCAGCFRAVLQIEPPEQFSRHKLLEHWRRQERR